MAMKRRMFGPMGSPAGRRPRACDLSSDLSAMDEKSSFVKSASLDFIGLFITIVDLHYFKYSI